MNGSIKLGFKGTVETRLRVDEDCVRSCFSTSESESGSEASSQSIELDLDSTMEDGDVKGKGKEEGSPASTEWSCIASSVSFSLFSFPGHLCMGKVSFTDEMSSLGDKVSVNSPD